MPSGNRQLERQSLVNGASILLCWCQFVRTKGSITPILVAMTVYRFHFFGMPNFVTSAGDSIAIRSRKGVGLLAYLALAEGKPVGRDQLCALLWSDRQSAQARASLRQLLVDLRHDFGPARDIFN